MSGGLPSDEVAEDYKASLEYLTSNDRYAINNLTVIAKESTEHADAIAKVLEEHIRKVHPNHKLPALYVLDSIAKNIGTPYTLFLGHNLYRTFMGAYSLVDNNIRKKLDDMLRTWKNPVPGSIDSRPVFPNEITRPIENALIQARTATIQRQQQLQQRSQLDLLRQKAIATTPLKTWQDTPTPPQNFARYPPPVSQNHVSFGPPVPNGQQTQYPYPSFDPYNPPPYQQPLQPYEIHGGQSLPPPDIASLQRDIEALIPTTRDQFARDPYDGTIQTRLKALLDLQTALKTQHVEPHMLLALHDRINQLQKEVLLPAPVSTPILAPLIASTPVQVPYQTQPSLPALPSAASLADLLASVARNKQPPPTLLHPRATPPIQAQVQQIQIPPPQVTPASGSGSSFIASLRAAGLILPAGGTPANGAAGHSSTPSSYPPHPIVNTPPVNLSNLASLVKPFTQRQRPETDIELSSASLKKPRPDLIPRLYEARPNQCSTCGKRFLITEEGRKRKVRHLDWHFRTNQRLADSAKRGQSRSWYVDEMEWIKSRDNVESIDVTANGGMDPKALAAEAEVRNDPKTKFIPVPSDSVLASLPCPVCQERFDPSWNDEAQDFVWMDAEKIGPRVYHASCYAEWSKDGANTPRTSTPDSVLGKRKAEAANSNPSPAKIKKEIAT